MENEDPRIVHESLQDKIPSCIIGQNYFICEECKRIKEDRPIRSPLCYLSHEDGDVIDYSGIFLIDNWEGKAAIIDLNWEGNTADVYGIEDMDTIDVISDWDDFYKTDPRPFNKFMYLGFNDARERYSFPVDYGQK